MAEKINISNLKFDTYMNRSVMDFSVALGDKVSTLRAGGASSAIGAIAAASAQKAVRMSAGDDPAMNKVSNDLETLRKYLIFLIDEEIKAKDPLLKRLGTDIPAEELEAAWRTACTIIDEQLYTIAKIVEVVEPVADKICPCAVAEACAAMFYAKAAMNSIRVQMAEYSTHMIEEVYAHTTRREPEIAVEQYTPVIDKIVKTLEAKL